MNFKLNHMKVSDKIIIKSALKAYGEKVRGIEDQTEITKNLLIRIQELRTKSITADNQKITIEL